jgi:lipopolysaccharide transport system ATP-binding protein
MSDVAIRVEGLGKLYRLGKRERYRTLRDTIVDTLAAPFRRLRSGRSKNGPETMWALKDVSFEVKPGEVVGIIGRNGAGKSTLLKILSRITEPTEGEAEIHGRISTLLEVGTGFHPELTGRDNIYLNGAILGMHRAEIARKFDEIVAFAEIEKFLDTPVKHYSSGMYVRLAFAVAAHLEPDILVVDEVLAVGDAEFQKKCLGKMSDVALAGRTVLFVSHNMAAIETLCPRSIHLASGALVGDASTRQVITEYLQNRASARNAPVRLALGGLALEGACHAPATIRCGGPAELRFAFRAERAGWIRECAVLLYTARGQRVAAVDLRRSVTVPLRYGTGPFTIIVRIAEIPFVENDYSIGLYLVTDAFSGNILDLDEFTVRTSTSSDFTPYPADVRGVVVLKAAASVASGQPAEAVR